MKKLFLVLLLIVGFIFAAALNAQALPFPDTFHPPLTQADTPVPDTTEGSGMVSKIFSVPTGGTIISFDYNLITAEFWDPPGDPVELVPDVNDYFGVALMDLSSGDDTLEFYYIADIYTSSFTLLSSPATGPHGSYFTHETGVLGGYITISSEYEGMDLALGFGVFDLEDRVVDTAVLLDNISLLGGDFSGGLGGFIFDDMYAGNVHLLPDGSLSGVDTTGFSGDYAYISNGPDAMVPEPATIALLGIGLLGLAGGAVRRRRKKIAN